MSQSSVFDGVELRAGANDAEIARAENALHRPFPADYKEFLRISNGIEGPIGAHAYWALWGTDELEPLNTDYAVSEFLPGVVLFGTDGGNTGYGFQEITGGFRYISVSLVGMSVEEIEDRGGQFSALVEWLRRL
jgi:hypothetical protein